MSKKRFEEPLNPVIIPAIHRKWYVDIQFLPKTNRIIGIIEAREGLTGWL
jgi:hypothetical protein